ncbi:MAG TPA: S8 family serine peptidase [Jiangellaceae bacterium]
MALPHRVPERLLVLPLAGLIAATLAAPAAGSSTPLDLTANAPDEQPTALIDEPVTVTLITGDRVRLLPAGEGDQPEVIVDPAVGSEPTGFSVTQDERGIQVIPHDVADLVPDVLDPALFNVTQLIEMGYDDASASELPLIVQHHDGVRTLAARSPLNRRANLAAIHGAAAHLDKDETPEFGDDLAAIEHPEPDEAAAALGGVTKVWLDRKVTSAELDGYLTQVSAPAAWDSGLDGSGVTIAVLDTGVDAGHPDLTGQVVAEADFTGSDSPADDNGHGTHVASVAAGTGAGADGARQGIAPGADLISGKVLDSEGRGQASWVMAGMDWAVQQGADIVNMSLGGPPTETDDPLVLTLEALTEQHGTLFVVAAGNRGWLGFVPGTIETPGSAPSALTVGAVTDTDLRAFFSSQGPTLGTYRLKPDVAAPGVNILGALAGARDGDLYQPMSGTSQATPIVAGAAALLRQQHPDWTWNQIKTRIVTTADVPDRYMAWSHGGGRVDLGEATSQQLVSDVGSLDFGYLKYPDEDPRTRTVTLTNTGTDPVEVVVDDVVRSDMGQPAVEDALVAEPAALTVPAGGSAATTVTFRPELVDDGFWEGGMSFTSEGETLLHLPFGAYDEPERYDLEIQLLDRNGQPYDPATGADHPYGDVTVPIFNADNGFFYRLRPDENGYAEARVAPGSYSVFGRIVTPAGGDEPETLTIAGTPELIVESDVSYVIDAREADRLDPPRVSDQRTSPEHLVGITYSRHTDDRGYTEIGFFQPEEVTNGQIYVTPTSTAERGTFEATFRWRLIPVGEVKPTSPDAYELLLASPRFPDPLSPALTARDISAMAEVETTFHPVGQPGEYAHGVVHQAAETGIGFIYRAPVVAPTSSTVLATAEPNILWAQCINPPANNYAEMCDELRSYEPRERVASQFGAALRPEIWESRHSASSMFLSTGIGDGEHAVFLTPTAAEASSLTLYRDGELIDSVDDSAGFFPVPDGPARFRLEQSWLLSSEFSRSRKATTVWEFDSAPPTDPSQQGFSTTPPLMAIRYGAPVDDMGGVAAQRSLLLELDVSHKSGSQAPESVESMSVWWSLDDGETWSPATTRQSGPTSYDAVIPGNVLAAGDALSLRVSATDADGNSIDQIVIGIFPVAQPVAD